MTKRTSMPSPVCLEVTRWRGNGLRLLRMNKLAVEESSRHWNRAVQSDKASVTLEATKVALAVKE